MGRTDVSNDGSSRYLRTVWPWHIITKELDVEQKQTYTQSRIWESVMRLTMNCSRPFNINICSWICGSRSGRYNSGKARSFGGTYRLHLQGRRASQTRNQQKQAVSFSLMTGFIRVTWRHDQEIRTFNMHYSCIKINIWTTYQSVKTHVWISI
jgi:hypothetical protein